MNRWFVDRSIDRMCRKLVNFEKVTLVTIEVLLLLVTLNSKQFHYLPLAKALPTTQQAQLVFFDDFEDYEIGVVPSTWEILVGADLGKEYLTDVEVVDYAFYSPTKSLYLQGIVFLTVYAVTAKRTFSSENRYIGFEFQISTDAPGHQYHSLWASGKGRVISVDIEYGEISVHDPDTKQTITIQEMEGERWYKIAGIIDRETRKWNLWIDDVLRAENIGTYYSEHLYSIDSIWLTTYGPNSRAWFDDVKVYEGFHQPPSPHPEPTVEVNVVNQYETNKLNTFMDYVLFGIEYPIDCTVEATIPNSEDIDRVYLELSGATSGAMDMLETSDGHYEAEILAVEEFSVNEIRDVAYFLLKLLFACKSPVGGSLAPAPWTYSEPPDYEVLVDELVIVYDGGGEFRKQNPISPLSRLPTYKDVIESMLPIWGSDPLGTTVVAMSPVDILVTDPLGRRVGTVYENGAFVAEANEIPDSFYTGKDFTPEFIYIPNHPGSYDVQVFGVDSGEYVLDVLFQGDGQTVLEEFLGSVVEGTIHGYGMDVIPEFPSFLILPLFMILTLLAVMLYRRKSPACMQ